ncbi:hypothetical protein Tco_0068912 [Tanacetum coccineum]
MKEDMCNVPVWVKFYDISITVFTKDGLSAIAMKLGTPLILDSYTTDMCLESWNRTSFARDMIELRSDVELKDTLVVDIPKLEGEVFGHILDACPKKSVADVSKNLQKPRQAPCGHLVGVKPNWVRIEGSQIRLIRGNGSSSNTPIVEKIDKIECQIREGKLRWRESYLDNDDYDLYNDDVYENHDMSDHLQAICDDFDIMVRGRKKK